MKLKQVLKASGVKKTLADERGVILAAALVLVSVLTLIGTTAYVVTSTDIQIAANYKTDRIAFNLAQAGADYVRNQLAAGADLDGDGTVDGAQNLTTDPISWTSTTTLDDLQTGATGVVTITV